MRNSLQVFHSASSISRSEAEFIFSSGTPEGISSAIISLSLFDDDWEWVQSKCLELVNHSSYEVKASSIFALSNLARIHGKIDCSLVEPILRNLAKDHKISSDVEQVVFEMKTYLPDEYNCFVDS
jgi:hypothetical protein